MIIFGWEVDLTKCSSGELWTSFAPLIYTSAHLVVAENCGLCMRRWRMQQLRGRYALHTCFYIRALLWRQHQALNSAQLQATVSSTLMHRLYFHWLQKMNRNNLNQPKMVRALDLKATGHWQLTRFPQKLRHNFDPTHPFIKYMMEYYTYEKNQQ